MNVEILQLVLSTVRVYVQNGMYSIFYALKYA